MPGVSLKQEEPRITAVVERRVRQEELSRVIPPACGVVWERISKLGLPRTCRNLVVYRDHIMNIECGVVLPHAIEDTETVRCRTTPGGLVATAVHVGDYSRLGETHRAIIEFCTRRKLPLAGVSWEIYGHWDDDPSKRFTDVFYLLTEKTKVESPKSNA